MGKLFKGGLADALTKVVTSVGNVATGVLNSAGGQALAGGIAAKIGGGSPPPVQNVNTSTISDMNNQVLAGRTSSPSSSSRGNGMDTALNGTQKFFTIYKVQPNGYFEINDDGKKVLNIPKILAFSGVIGVIIFGVVSIFKKPKFRRTRKARRSMRGVMR